jgi:hypothetical protein
MELLYEKKIEKIEISMLFETNKIQNTWKIYLNTPSVNNLLIDKFEKKTETNIIFKSYGDIRKQVIIGDVIRKDSALYVMIYRFDKIFLSEYIFSRDETFICNEYFIGYNHRGSYLNFGDPYFRAEMKLYYNKLYIMAEHCGLVYFNFTTKKVYRIKFFELFENHMSNNDTFNNNSKIIKTIHDTSGNKPYLFYEMKEGAGYISLPEGRKGIPVYDKKDLMHPETSRKIEEYIKDVIVTFENISINKIILLWTFQELRNEDVTCFFYQEDNSNKMRIIRYNNDCFEWYINDYTEEEITAEILE